MAEDTKKPAAKSTATRKIKLTTAIAGKNFQHKHGEILEVASHVADRFVANGDAVEVTPDTKPDPKGDEK